MAGRVAAIRRGTPRNAPRPQEWSMRITRIVAVLAAGLMSALTIPSGAARAAVSPAALPAYTHIVMVIEENHSYSEVIGNANAPYITSLANTGAKMTQSFAVTHPS